MRFVVYHEVAPGVPCPDGLAAAWVAAKALGEGCQLVGRCYKDERPLMAPVTGDEVYIVDFSFPAHILEEWAKSAKVVVIDHHKTALENLSGLSSRVLQRFDMAESGATLAWKFFFPDEQMPVFLEYVKDRDLWNHALPQTEEVHAAYAVTGRSFGLYDRLAEMSREKFLEYMAPIGEPAVLERKAKVTAIASRWEYLNVAGYSVPGVVLASDGTEDWLVSDVCQRLYLDLPEALFTACYLHKSGQWSLRSNKDGNNTDVGSIAKANGGGGHKNAAGFPGAAPSK